MNLKFLRKLWRLARRARALKRQREWRYARWRWLAENNRLGSDDFAALSREFNHVLVIMLDLLEDPPGARPALFRLRQIFPDSHITLVCGTENQIMVKCLNLVNKVLVFDFFDIPTAQLTGNEPDLFSRFRNLVGEDYDLAIDMRTEPDTRFLLRAVKNGLKCGIGARWRFPFLDIACPGPDDLDAQSVGTRIERIEAARFSSNITQTHPFVWPIDLSTARGHIVYGPYIRLARGSYRVTFWCSPDGLGDQIIQAPITFEVSADFNVIQKKTITNDDREALVSQNISLEFNNESPEIAYEFRVYMPETPFDGKFLFYGSVVERLTQPSGSALDRSDYLMFLFDLIAARLTIPRGSQEPQLP